MENKYSSVREALNDIKARLKVGESISAAEFTAIEKAYPELVQGYFDRTKYFTPSIEDIRVGYELETDYPITNSEFVKQVITKEDLGFHITMLGGASYRYRVPYLTKEQIEAEGWEIDSAFHMLTGEAYKKNEFELHHIGRTIKIWKPNHFGSFTGDCKDINTFRYICKLLGI